MRCLVADRSATMRALARNALRRAGATEVLTAATVDEALAAAEAQFDLVIVDRDLGSGPGWQWLADLREKACAAGRLIVTGTRVSREEAEHMRELGGGAFLLRPLDPERLADRVLQLTTAPAAGEEPLDSARSGNPPLAEAA